MSEKLPLEKKKQTGDQKVDGLAPKLFKNWKTLDFKNCIEQSPGIKCKLKKTKIKNSGKVPVIDQGENFIAGYTDDKATIYNCSLPIIIFGDHTRHIKFVDIEFAVGADGTKIIKPKQYYDIRFFYHYLNSLNWQHCGYGRHYKYLKQLEVPLPPINEQKRIAAKLYQIMPKIDGVKERLERIPQIIKHFRQSVLNAAVTGKLTEKWREDHPEVESAELLLHHIVEERKKMKRKTEQKYSFKVADEIDNRFIDIDTPPTWIKTNVDLVSIFIVDCPHSTPKWTKSGKICLRTTNFLPNKLDISEIRYVSTETFNKRIERLKPEKGDILYSREGGILGIACILDIDDEICLGQRMMIFRTSKYILNKYFSYYLNSPPILRHLNNLIGGSASPHINIRDIKKYPFPLPPFEEQKEIVRQVDKLFAYADKLEEHYQKANEKVVKFPQSVIAKAFRGELVPQDPNDEPAEKLLERIKEEKTRLEADMKKTRKKTTRKKK